MENKILGSVEVLLSTYNGSSHIDEQMESLCRQTHTGFRLITRDDGSRDDTIARVDSYGDRLQIVRIDANREENLGAMRSYDRLLRHSTADIVMFCDQDDIWNDEKIERVVAHLTERQERYGGIPLLGFSDLILMDNCTARNGRSFMDLHGINVDSLDDPYYLVFHNPAPGCSMVFNRALVASTPPCTGDTYMHDWWLSIVAGLKGKLFLIPEPLVRYRLHASNAIGIVEDRPLPALLSICTMLNPRKLFQVLAYYDINLRQGEAAFRACGTRFSPVLFWTKLFFGRYVAPQAARISGKMSRFCWKARSRDYI